MRRLIPTGGLLLVTIVGAAAHAQPERPAKMSKTDRERWQVMTEELEVQKLLHGLTTRRTGGPPLLIRDVTVLPMTAARVLHRQSVLIDGDRITAMGPVDSIRAPPDAREIDGRRLFLVPGLTDMHVHGLTTSAQHLLNVRYGVTSVREMGGFAWMLRLRDRVNARHVPAPAMYVAGPILTEGNLGWYGTRVRSAPHARRLVREQAKAGYDFVKIHNAMTPEVLDAIFDEARRQDLHVVGHIPVGITVAHATRAGLRTAEHFKGYFVDSTLKLSTEDWEPFMRGSSLWNCPTFYTRRTHLRGAPALKLLADRDMRFVPPRLRRAWRTMAEQPPDRVTLLRQEIFEMSRAIFERMRRIGYDRFVAGTDSGGGYAMQVFGAALHDELATFQALGMSPFEALQTATVHAARALDRSDEIGTIAVGKRADLLLLRKNPLDDVRHTRAIAGVMLRGRWFESRSLDKIESGLLRIYERFAGSPETFSVEPPSIDRIVSEHLSMSGEGFVFRDHDLERLASMLLDIGRPDDGSKIRSLKTDPAFRLP